MFFSMFDIHFPIVFITIFSYFDEYIFAFLHTYIHVVHDYWNVFYILLNLKCFRIKITVKKHVKLVF